MKAVYFPLSLFLLAGMLVFSACREDPPPPPPGPTTEDPMSKLDLTPYELNLPPHFPQFPIPEDNDLTVAKVELGKKLFYDPVLSVDYSVSCASCHLQSHGFSDPNRVSLGVNGVPGTRQSMALSNLGYHPAFFWDGNTPTLEEQALVPIEADFEMNNTVEEAINRLNADEAYVEMFHTAFGADPDADNLAKALASFERSMISGSAPYDSFLLGNRAALTPSQMRGYVIFNSEVAECFHCHNGHNFTDHSFRSNGLKETYIDQGRAIVTGEDKDVGLFKVPSLRNIEYTAPYMHDGSLETLEEVIEFYMSGGSSHRNKDVLIRPFYLNPQEQQDLLNFLKSLSDKHFMTDPEFAAPE
jgi:cytochrome c peroxidase